MKLVKYWDWFFWAQTSIKRLQRWQQPVSVCHNPTMTSLSATHVLSLSLSPSLSLLLSLSLLFFWPLFYYSVFQELRLRLGKREVYFKVSFWTSFFAVVFVKKVIFESFWQLLKQTVNCIEGSVGKASPSLKWNHYTS
jgi:hypothetical protein